MPDETPLARLPALAAELWQFNEMRRQQLGNRPIDPEGMRELGPLVFDDPEQI